MNLINSAVGPVVVGVDGSQIATHAAVWAAYEVAVLPASLRIINAWSSSTIVGSAPSYPMVVGSAAGFGSLYFNPQLQEDGAQAVVADAKATVLSELSEQSPAILETIPGNPASVLTDAAVDASMLVVGTRGRGGLASLLLGSVSIACTHHATVPVVVVDDVAGLPGCGDVVVGVDDSDGSRAALRWAAIESGRLHVRLIVVHGRDVQDASPPGGMVFDELHRQAFLSDANRLMGEMVKDAMAGLERPPIGLEVRPVELAAPQALLHEARGAGLLVVGNRGRGEFTGLFLGSVSQQCVRHAPCAVAVIPSHCGRIGRPSRS